MILKTENGIRVGAVSHTHTQSFLPFFSRHMGDKPLWWCPLWQHCVCNVKLGPLSPVERTLVQNASMYVFSVSRAYKTHASRQLASEWMHQDLTPSSSVRHSIAPRRLAALLSILHNDGRPGCLRRMTVLGAACTFDAPQSDIQLLCDIGVCVHRGFTGIADAPLFHARTRPVKNMLLGAGACPWFDGTASDEDLRCSVQGRRWSRWCQRRAKRSWLRCLLEVA